MYQLSAKHSLLCLYRLCFPFTEEFSLIFSEKRFLVTHSMKTFNRCDSHKIISELLTAFLDSLSVIFIYSSGVQSLLCSLVWKKCLASVNHRYHLEHKTKVPTTPVSIPPHFY